MRKTKIWTAAITVALAGAGCQPSEPVAEQERALGGGVQLLRLTGASPYPDGCPGGGVEARNEFFGDNFAGAEVEPQLAVNPANRQDLVATWFQDASATYMSAVSRNGGKTWRTVHVPGVSRCDDEGGAPAAADPWLSIGPDSAIYLSGFSVYLDAFPAPFPTRQVLNVSRGTFAKAPMTHHIDWAQPVEVTAGAVVFHDRPSVKAHPREPGRAYVVWTDGTAIPPLLEQPLMFAGTYDGGQTWSIPAPVHAPAGGVAIGGEVEVLPNGRLVVLWVDVRADADTGALPHLLSAAVSDDDGATWSTPVVIEAFPAGAPTPIGDDCRTVYSPTRDPGTGQCIYGPEPIISAESAPDGSTWVVWRHALGENHSEIRYAHSADGANWSTPARVSPHAGRAEQFVPALAITEDGVVGVSWHDTRADITPDPPAQPFFTLEMWFAQSSDGGATWRERLIGPAFNALAAPFRRIPSSGYFLGDYTGLVALPDGFGAVFAMSPPQAREGATDLFYASVPVERR